MVNAFGRFTFWIGLAVAATLVVTGFGESQARPFGGTIAFVARSGEAADLFVIHADGTRLRQVTRDAREEQSPSWSPDGKSIALIATTWQPSGEAISTITIVAANGSKRRVLFRTQLQQLPLYDLAWSPNGRRIAFTWFRNNAYGLWLLRLDGSADPRSRQRRFRTRAGRLTVSVLPTSAAVESSSRTSRLGGLDSWTGPRSPDAQSGPRTAGGSLSVRAAKPEGNGSSHSTS